MLVPITVSMFRRAEPRSQGLSPGCNIFSISNFRVALESLMELFLRFAFPVDNVAVGFVSAFANGASPTNPGISVEGFSASGAAAVPLLRCWTEDNTGAGAVADVSASCDPSACGTRGCRDIWVISPVRTYFEELAGG